MRAPAFLIAVFLALVAGSGDLALAATKDTPVYYLALGDSLSVGAQPAGPTGQTQPTNQGYADDLCRILVTKTHDLRARPQTAFVSPRREEGFRNFNQIFFLTSEPVVGEVDRMKFVILLNLLSIALGIASISLSVFILRRIAQ